MTAHRHQDIPSPSGPVTTPKLPPKPGRQRLRQPVALPPDFDPKVQRVLDELVDVYRFFTLKELPEDLVKELVLHHQSHYLERM